LSCRDCLLDELGKTRSAFIESVADLSADDFVRIPLDAKMNVAWIVGHIALGDDYILKEIQPEYSRVTSERETLFSEKASPHEDPSAYPTMPDLLHYFNGCRQRLIASVECLSMDPSAEPAPEILDRFLTKILRHESFHLGQLLLLRRLLEYPVDYECSEENK